jgi:hypothetical protein
MGLRYNSIIPVTQLFVWYHFILNRNQIHIVTELPLIKSLSRQFLLSFLNLLFLLVLVLLLDHGGGDAGSRSSAAPKSTATAAATDSCAITAPPPSSHPEPRMTLETTPSHPELPDIKSVDVVDPGIESLEVVALLPASNPSPHHAAGGNSTIKVSFIEVPRLSESVEAAPCHTRFLSQNRMLIVCMPKNQVYTHTVQKMETE